MAEDKNKEDASSLKELFQKISPSGKDGENQTVSFSSIQQWMKGALGPVKNISEGEISSTLSKVAKSSKDSLNMEEFQQFIAQLASKGKMKTSDFVSSLKNAVPSGISGAKDALDKAVSSGKSGAKDALDNAVPSGISGAKDALDKAVSSGKSGAKDALDNAVSSGKSGATDTLDKAVSSGKSEAKDALDNVKDLARWNNE